VRYLALLLALVACGHHDRTKTDSGTATGDGAATDGAGSGSGSSTSIDGQLISCYSQGNPAATCTLPVHCCFSNFSAQHDGACGTSNCAWGTIECDGPEDCSDGGHCCSTQLTNQDGIYGYRVACQASACGASPAHEELCNAASPACSSGSCVSAFGLNNDLPRSLYICR
jgi:hypothetical protein